MKCDIEHAVFYYKPTDKIVLYYGMTDTPSLIRVGKPRNKLKLYHRFVFSSFSLLSLHYSEEVNKIDWNDYEYLGNL